MRLLSRAWMAALSLAAPLSLAALPARAQASDAALAARMQGFVRAAPAAPNDSVAAFFPRRSDWTWVHTRQPPGRHDAVRVGTWRFGGAETLRAIGTGGPVCESFDGPGGVGPPEERLGMQALMHRGPWRRVRGTRFVPAGASAGSPVFVEWRRENGTWVVSAFGDVGVYAPPVLGRDAPAPWRDTTAVSDGAAFAAADWYTITLSGLPYLRYGLPRTRDRSTLMRIGVFQGVSVFTEPDEDADRPYVVHLPTAPGQFQAYQAPHGPYVCR